MKEYIAKTLEIMKALNIEVRDTYISEYNIDDFYTNRGYGGPQLFRIE